MATIVQPSLFDWRDIDVSSDLDRLDMVLSVLPEQESFMAIRALRLFGENY